MDMQLMPASSKKYVSMLLQYFVNVFAGERQRFCSAPSVLLQGFVNVFAVVKYSSAASASMILQ